MQPGSPLVKGLCFPSNPEQTAAGSCSDRVKVGRGKRTLILAFKTPSVEQRRSAVREDEKFMPYEVHSPWLRDS